MTWMITRALSTLVLAVSLLLLASPAPPSHAQESCSFQLGFKVLHDMIPDIVGQCVTDEMHDPENGDGLQFTTNGMLVWRKADNWTAFTNGYMTWVNGPYGLQSRLNSERFAWEQGQQSPGQQPSGQHTSTVQLFFSHQPESLNDFTAVFPVQRTVQYPDQQIATATMKALIDGPTPSEQAQGYFSELGGMLSGPSTCGGQDFTISLDANGTATLQFCRQTSSAGIGQDARVMNEIEATLTQFSTIDHVRTLNNNGQCLFDLSGMNNC